MASLAASQPAAATGTTDSVKEGGHKKLCGKVADPTSAGGGGGGGGGAGQTFQEVIPEIVAADLAASEPPPTPPRPENEQPQVVAPQGASVKEGGHKKLCGKVADPTSAGGAGGSGGGGGLAADLILVEKVLEELIAGTYDALSRGAVRQILDGEQPKDPVLQVVELKTLSNGNIRIVLSDGGSDFLIGMLSKQLTQLFTSGEVREKSIISLGVYKLSDMRVKKVAVILRMNVVQKDADKIEDSKDSNSTKIGSLPDSPSDGGMGWIRAAVREAKAEDGGSLRGQKLKSLLQAQFAGDTKKLLKHFTMAMQDLEAAGMSTGDIEDFYRPVMEGYSEGNRAILASANLFVATTSAVVRMLVETWKADPNFLLSETDLANIGDITFMRGSPLFINCTRGNLAVVLELLKLGVSSILQFSILLWLRTFFHGFQLSCAL